MHVLHVLSSSLAYYYHRYSTQMFMSCAVSRRFFISSFVSNFCIMSRLDYKWITTYSNSNNNSLRNRHDINMSITTSTSTLSPNHTTLPVTCWPFPLLYTMVLYNTYHVSRITYHKKNSEFDTIWVDILFQIKSNQINSTQWYQVYVREIKRIWISPSETESYQLMLLQ